MTLIDKIRSLQVESKTSNNTAAALLYTALVEEVTAAGVNGRNTESSDDEVILVIKKFIKQNEDSHALLINLMPRCDDLVYENPIKPMNEIELWQLSCHLKVLQSNCNTLLKFAKAK